MNRYCYTYQSVIESVGEMLDSLQSILTKHKIEGNLASAIMLTASEAFTNALIHGNHQNPNKSIQVDIEINPLTVKIEVIDQGSGEIDFAENRLLSEPMLENGRGIVLMKHYTTDLQFSKIKSGGVKVSMRFDRTIEYESKLNK